jgi:hypothetical protein
MDIVSEVRCPGSIGAFCQGSQHFNSIVSASVDHSIRFALDGAIEYHEEGFI